MEGVIGFLGFIFFGIIVFGVFQLLAGKYAGAKFHGKFGYSNAKRESDEDEQTFSMLKTVDPEGISKAITICKNKKFVLTHTNIINEYEKLSKSN